MRGAPSRPHPNGQLRHRPRLADSAGVPEVGGCRRSSVHRFGERVSCGRLVVLHAPVLEEFQRFVPDVETGDVQVLTGELPAQLASPEARSHWLDKCKENARRYFGHPGVWSSS